MNEKDYTIKTISENGKMGMIITHKATGYFLTKLIDCMNTYREQRTKAIHELDKIIKEMADVRTPTDIAIHKNVSR